MNKRKIELYETNGDALIVTCGEEGAFFELVEPRMLDAVDDIIEDGLQEWSGWMEDDDAEWSYIEDDSHVATWDHAARTLTIHRIPGQVARRYLGIDASDIADMGPLPLVLTEAAWGDILGGAL